MADPVDLILDFLKRHNFEKAASAFKAELSDRERSDTPVLSTENVTDWDLQLRSPSVESVSRSLNTLPLESQMASSSSAGHANSGRDEKESNEPPPGRIVSPPEKQLYVEYEPGKQKTQESSSIPRNDFSFENAARISPELESTVPLKAAYVSSPIYQVETAMSALDRSTSATMQSSSFSLRPTENQAWQPNGNLDDRSSKKDNEVVQRQQITTSIPPFESLAGLSGRAQIQQLAQMEPLHSECVRHLDDKGEVNCKNMLPLNNKHGIKGSDKALKGPLIEEELPSDASHVNSFMARGTSGAPPLKTLLPIPFLQYGEHQKTSLPEFPEDSDIRKVFIANLNDAEKIHHGKEPIVVSGHAEHSARSRNIDSSSNNSQPCEELPRLPPVRLHLIGKNTSVQENDADTDEASTYRQTDSALEVALGWPTSTDCLLGNDLSTSGSKRVVVRPSVSQGIVDAVSDHLSGFTILADGQNERWYPDEYCDSDTYEDDDDPGYIRQPIEDEEWFLTHEIDYPSDNERSKRHMELNPVGMSSKPKKLDEDERSLVEEESYFSGEEYYKAQAAKRELYASHQIEVAEPTFPNLFDNNPLALATVGGGGYDYGSQAHDNQEVAIVSSQPVWKGFVGQPNQIEDQAAIDYTLPGSPPDVGEDDNGFSVLSAGIQANSDAADIGSEVRESLLGASSEGDTESVREQEVISYGPTHDPKIILSGRHIEEKSAPVQHLEEDMILQYFDQAWGHTKKENETGDGSKLNTEPSDKAKENSKKKHLTGHTHKVIPDNDGYVFEGFSFPSPSSTGEVVASTAGSGKSIWSNRESPAQAEETDAYASGMVGPDDTLAAWKRKSSDSSPILGSSEENIRNLKAQHMSSDSLNSTDEFVSLETREPINDESDVPLHQAASKPLAQEEDDALAGQEYYRPVGLDKDQYEIFELRIIHRKNRTGFEEEKDFPVIINSVVAGRYHVTEYLGSAAFSKAIQAHDLHTGMDVCMKIIKNNKDFFDQSLDEIKLLKFVNKHDPADKHHILRLYDYFYHQEHLFIVCELLRANLYEFHKFNRESGGEVYFTMPRLQSITRQCLEGLQFLHSLGIIHCDLKPENILVKSYSRCEIKIIDLGSSCFETDHLCSYVQSRSYRAPEVILGLPYDKKIDIWSLGCILAELCTGNVLFQNDSLATLLARVVGIIGPIESEVLSKGRDTHKYFTKNHMLYERNQDTDQLEYLIPKKTSLKHRLPMGDAGFIEFVRYLLQTDPAKRPTATEALQHPWLSYPYEPISS